MRTPHTDRTATAPAPGLTAALDDLVLAAEQVADGTRHAVLARTVRLLEEAAGAGLGGTDDEPLVVLQRRLGRAHRRLAAARTSGLSSELVRAHADALRGCRSTPEQAPGAAAPTPVGALVPC